MKGICFKETLFHATIEGRKTQTRRLVVSSQEYPDGTAVHEYEDGSFGFFKDGFLIERVKPRYKVGDVVYLKEPYALIPKAPDSAFISTAQMIGDYCVFHKWNPDDLSSLKWDVWDYDEPGFWKNKLFMPGWAARYFIKIITVRAERLQDISDEDCFKEGIWMAENVGRKGVSYWYGGCINSPHTTPQQAYAALIDKINGRGTWEGNPWVWVYDYELYDKK